MCGIIGYLGKQQATPILLDGLKRLEYRGYDSAGVAVQTATGSTVVKSLGKIVNLREKIDQQPILGTMGLAHTRWATHGIPSEVNAHPHGDCSDTLWLVHNGIIENYASLKSELQSAGHRFKSETDSEVLVHLIESFYTGDLFTAVQAALQRVRGAYAIAVFSAQEPNTMIAARFGSPLVIGLGEDETIIASDPSAIVRHTKRMMFLDDGEMVQLKDTQVNVFSFSQEKIDKHVQEIDWDVSAAQKSGYPHFMLKEIFEQPTTITESMRGRIVLDEGKVKLGGLESVADRLRTINRVVFCACGTAYNAASIGEYMFEEYAGIPTEVEYASEFRYRKPVIDANTAVIVISQSGETADTLAAVREGNEKGALTLGIVNTVGSTIARETVAGVYNHIGPEIAVASTKAFTSQLTILALLTVMFGRQRQMSGVMGKRILEELLLIPEKVKQTLLLSDQIKQLTIQYAQSQHFAFLGRKYNYPIAIEGALKLKEISYIHAEGFAAGEMKHGHIALIEPTFPTIYIAPHDSVFEKNVSNIQELKARRGPVIAITTEGHTELAAIADHVLYIPKTLEMLTPLLTAVPMQLFAYHMAVALGKDVDQPRNLAKSVTVE